MLKFFPPKLHSRGYIGPIGDDIPSLIPIIVGLITFFGAFTYTLNEYNHRSQTFAADRDSLVIANALKGDSYLATYSEFASACKGLRVRGLDYFAGVIDSHQWEEIAKQANSDQLNKLSLIADHLYPLADLSNPGTSQPLLCSHGLPSPPTSDDLALIIDNRQFIVLSFPVAVESPLAVVPATLVVITWKVG
ncbi:MAG: hypothetical protein AABX02_03995 [archaeon]